MGKRRARRQAPLAAHTSPGPRSAAAARRRAGATAAGTPAWAVPLFVAILAIYILTSGGHLSMGDAWATLATSENLVLAGDPAIEYQSGFPGSVGKDGRFYCQFGLGAVVDLIPAAVAGHLLARGDPHAPMGKLRRGLPATLVNPLATAITALALALALMRLGIGDRRAVAAAWVYALATFAWCHAHADMADPQVAAAVFVGFTLLLDDPADPDARGHFLLAGLALGWAFLIKLTAILFWPALLWMVWPRLMRQPASGVRLLVGPLLAVVLFAAYNDWRFGSPMSTGYSSAVQMSWIAPWIGIYGLTLSIGKGLIFFAPPVLLAVWGAHEIHLYHPRVSWTIALLTVLNLGFFGLQQNFGGDWSYGPRYLLPLLPFLMVWAAPALGSLPGAPLRWTLRASLIAFGFWVALLGVLIDHSGFVRWMSDQKAVLGDFLKEPGRVYIPLHEHYFNPDLTPIRGHAYLLEGTLAHALGRPVDPLPLYTSIQESSSRESHHLTRVLAIPYDDARGGLDLWWVLWMPIATPAGKLGLCLCALLLGLLALHCRRVIRARIRVAKTPPGR